MNIISWNVDGYTDKINNYVCDIINNLSPDIIFFNETKQKANIMEKYFNNLQNYNYVVNVHIPSNQHGICVLIKKNIDYQICDVKLDIVCRHDSLSNDASIGRIISLKLNNIIIVGTYIPNSGFGRSEKNYLHRTKIWDPAFYQYLNDLKSKYENIIWIGDINVAPENIDVSNPKEMSEYAGFSEIERENFKNFCKSGWYDAWRHQNKNVKKYTWISYKPRNNYGMRLDNIIVTKNLLNKIDPYMIYSELSDHIIIGAKINMEY